MNKYTLDRYTVKLWNVTTLAMTLTKGLVRIRSHIPVSNVNKLTNLLLKDTCYRLSQVWHGSLTLKRGRFELISGSRIASILNLAMFARPKSPLYTENASVQLWLIKLNQTWSQVDHRWSIAWSALVLNMINWPTLSKKIIGQSWNIMINYEIRSEPIIIAEACFQCICNIHY